MVFQLASELKLRKHNVVIVSIDGINSKAFYPFPEGVLWERIEIGNPELKANFYTRLKRVVALRSLLRKYEIDVAIGFQIGAFALLRVASLGLPIRTIAAERNAPTLFDFIKYGRVRRIFANFWLLTSDCVTVQMDSYRNLYPRLLQKRIFHTPNPVLITDQKKTSSIDLGKTLQILYVGRLTYQKNLEVLMEAIPLSGIPIHLSVVGDGESKQVLQALALENALKVEFIQPTSDLARYYLSADLFCIPSRWEGFPNVVGEALAHGLPVVAFRGCSGMSDLITERVNGVLAEGNDDAAKLSEAIRAAYAISWDTKKIVESCSSYTLQMFTDHWEAAISSKRIRSKL